MNTNTCEDYDEEYDCPVCGCDRGDHDISKNNRLIPCESDGEEEEEEIKKSTCSWRTKVPSCGYSCSPSQKIGQSWWKRTGYDCNDCATKSIKGELGDMGGNAFLGYFKPGCFGFRPTQKELVEYKYFEDMPTYYHTNMIKIHFRSIQRYHSFDRETYPLTRSYLRTLKKLSYHLFEISECYRKSYDEINPYNLNQFKSYNPYLPKCSFDTIRMESNILDKTFARTNFNKLISRSDFKELVENVLK